MPTIETTDLWSKGKTKPRKRRYRVCWPDPDNDNWKDVPDSKEFSCDMTDADANPPNWKSLGRYATKSSAQKAADSDVGYDIKEDQWS